MHMDPIKLSNLVVFELSLNTDLTEPDFNHCHLLLLTNHIDNRKQVKPTINL